MFSYNHVQNNISDFCDFIAIHRSVTNFDKTNYHLNTNTEHTCLININGKKNTHLKILVQTENVIHDLRILMANKNV